LPRTQATLRGVPDQRSLPVAGEDSLRQNLPSFRDDVKQVDFGVLP
jgi:hypothetical protein